MSTSWQKRRNELNHDWLKNRYLPALAKWMNILDDYVEDPTFETDFLNTVLPQWVEYRTQVVSLVECFEAEMSPSTRLLQPPLSRLPASTTTWLRTLTTALWISRYPISRWKSDTLSCVMSVGQAYQQLQELIHAEPTCTFVQFRSFRSQFALFQNHCQSLAKSIEMLPSRCLVC